MSCKYLDDFLHDLKLNVDECAESHAIDLWHECESKEEPLSGELSENVLSLLNRVAQAAYYKALDTMVEGLRRTLQEDED